MSEFTYTDLKNAYPDKDDSQGNQSDERYQYKDMAISDVAYVRRYYELVDALNAKISEVIAGKDLTDNSVVIDTNLFKAEWDALVSYKQSPEYRDHVEPFEMTALKFQILEDKVLSAQRFAKRQKQQWIISDSEPDKNEQAVDDIWFDIYKTENDIPYTVPKYKGKDGEYHEFSVTHSLNSLGVTASVDELNYCDGLTSNVQDQLNLMSESLTSVNNSLTSVNNSLNNKASSSHTHPYLPLTGGTVTGRVTATGDDWVFDKGIHLGGADVDSHPYLYSSGKKLYIRCGDTYWCFGEQGITLNGEVIYIKN